VKLQIHIANSSYELIHVLGFPMVEKNNIGEFGNMLSTKVETTLIVG
jgi:hypothetical protein